MSFKVGDRVILTRHISAFLKAGEMATVASRTGSYLTVHWDNHDPGVGEWLLDRFKLINPVKMDNSQPFTLEELTEWQDTATNASTG